MRKSLRNLVEHHKTVLAVIQEAERRRAENDWPSGYACPDCGSEMKYTNPFLVISMNPYQRELDCPFCGHHDHELLK